MLATIISILLVVLVVLVAAVLVKSSNLLPACTRLHCGYTTTPCWWVLSRGVARSYLHFRSPRHQEWRMDLLEARL